MNSKLGEEDHFEYFNTAISLKRILFFACAGRQLRMEMQFGEKYFSAKKKQNLFPHKKRVSNLRAYRCSAIFIPILFAEDKKARAGFI